MDWILLGIGALALIAIIIILCTISPPKEFNGLSDARREVDEKRLEDCPIKMKPVPPSISGQSRSISDVRTDPFWGPILFPEGPDDDVNAGELASHLSDYMRLSNGAAEIVSIFACGMSGGYKFYTAEAVASQIQETIDNESKNAVDDFISDHDIDEMKAFVVDIEKAMGCPNNQSDWRKSPEGQEFKRRADLLR